MFVPPPLSLPKNRDPAKTNHVRSMPQSRSEPTLYGLDGRQEINPAKHHLPTHSSPTSPTRSQSSASSGAAGGSRGRPVNRSNSPIKMLQDVNENEVLDVQKVSRKRSRSPIKRLLGLGKSTSLKDIADEPQAQAREEHADKAKRTGLQIWGDKFRYGFLVSLCNAAKKMCSELYYNRLPNQRQRSRPVRKTFRTLCHHANQNLPSPSLRPTKPRSTLKWSS